MFLSHDALLVIIIDRNCEFRNYGRRKSNLRIAKDFRVMNLAWVQAAL